MKKKKIKNTIIKKIKNIIINEDEDWLWKKIIEKFPPDEGKETSNYFFSFTENDRVISLLERLIRAQEKIS